MTSLSETATAWTQERIASLPSADLRAIVRSTVPTGVFAAQVVWARAELERRAA